MAVANLTRRVFLKAVATLWYFIRGTIGHPIMPQVTLTHPDGSTETIAQTVGWRWEREVGKMFKLKISVTRDDAQAVTLNKKSDEVNLSGVTTGRLVDVNRGGATYELIVYSFEWDGNRNAPTDGGDLRQDTDKALIDTFINDVSEWTIGTTNALTGTLTFVFNHALPHEAMRRIERNTPGELRFNADKSVDYVQRLGSDKSASITLKPGNANLDGDITVKDRGRTMDATHVRIIGAHEGEAQKFANLVPSGDTTAQSNLSNVVTYSQPRWSNSSDTDWTRWSNKDAMAQATVDEVAAALADELTEEHIEVSATVVGEDLSVGDTVHVEKPEAEINRDMRIQRIVTKSNGAKTVDECFLSTRSLARDTEQERLRDVERFNVAFQGSSVVLQGGGDRQPVTSTFNAIVPFRYPNIDFEHVAELEVRGLPYRAYSSGAVDNANFTNVEEQKTELSQVSLDNSGVNVVDSFTVASTPGISMLFFHMHMFDIDGNLNSVDLVELRDTTDSITYPVDPGPAYNLDDGAPFFATVQKDVSGHSFDVVISPGLNQAGADVQFTWVMQTSGKHTHDPDPGVIDTFPNESGANANDKLLPSGCDVIINGTTVATDIGSGDFQTVVDIADDLNQGQWNTIEVTSDSIGHILATPFITAYKQVGTK